MTVSECEVVYIYLSPIYSHKDFYYLPLSLMLKLRSDAMFRSDIVMERFVVKSARVIQIAQTFWVPERSIVDMELSA